MGLWHSSAGWLCQSTCLPQLFSQFKNLAGVNAATTHCLFKIQKIKRIATRYHTNLRTGCLQMPELIYAERLERDFLYRSCVLGGINSGTIFSQIESLRQTCTQPKHPSRRMNILYWKNRDTKSKDKNFPFTFGFKA